MADKEERICICKLEGNAIDSVCGGSMTRQEAIEVMAKGLHLFEWEHNKNIPQWTELNNDIQDDYKNMARAAVNALLQRGK